MAYTINRQSVIENIQILEKVRGAMVAQSVNAQVQTAILSALAAKLLAENKPMDGTDL